MLPSIVRCARSLTEFHIPAPVRHSLEKIFYQYVDSPYENKHVDDLSHRAFQVLKTELPLSLQAAIAEVKTTHKGFLELTGMPKDPSLPPTPTAEGIIERTKKTHIKELFALGLQGFLDEKIFNYRQEGWGNGHLIFNIFPRKELSNLKGAGGYENDFRFHTENGWHSRRIKSLFLVGLRQDHNKEAITYCTSNAQIYSELTTLEKEILSTENFRLAPPEIHRRMEQEKGIIFTEDTDYVGPILQLDASGFPELRVNFNGMRVEMVNEVAMKALERVETIARTHAAKIRLSEDNMVIINNLKAIHTRNGYTPRFDGADRWFQRYFLTDEKTLWPSHPLSDEAFSSFLSQEHLEILFNHLKMMDLIDEKGKLTHKFMPHVPSFHLCLPLELRSFEPSILKIMIKFGPAKPHRVL